MCGYLSNLFFSALFTTCPGRELAAARDGLQEKGATMESSNRAGESWHLLFNEYLGATVRVYDICETSGHRCMPAVDNSVVPTTTAVVLLCVHWFVAD